MEVDVRHFLLNLEKKSKIHSCLHQYILPLTPCFISIGINQVSNFLADKLLLTVE